MRAFISGINGTIGRSLAAALQSGRHEVRALPRDTADQSTTSIAELFNGFRPDAIFHLAIASRPTGRENEHHHINVEWPARLAEACSAARVRFLFTSTAMVFSDRAPGPFTIRSQPDAAEGYGFQKRTAEQRVRQANPDAVIVRLGWQIGNAPGGNQMLSYFEQHMREKGVVRASRKWLPACSFLDDTSVALIDLVGKPGGTYHLDSNRHWNFFEIATALRERADAPWKIEPTEDFMYDQRLLDDCTDVPSLQARLPGLPAR